MGWQQSDESLKNVKGSRFIKLDNDGDEVIICLPYVGIAAYGAVPTENDEPAVEETFWDEKLGRPVPYTTQHRDEGKEISAKYTFHAYVKPAPGEPNPTELHFFKCTPGTLKQIMVYRDKKRLDRTFLTVKRNGASGSKKTKYYVSYDDAVNDEQLKIIESLRPKRVDLRRLGDDDDDNKKSDGQRSSGSATAPETEPKISDTQATTILPKLKALSEELRRGFLNHFKIARARDLDAKDFDRAVKWVEADGKPQDDAFS